MIQAHLSSNNSCMVGLDLDRTIHLSGSLWSSASKTPILCRRLALVHQPNAENYLRRSPDLLLELDLERFGHCVPAIELGWTRNR